MLVETFNPWAYLRLRKILADFRPDVVHVRVFRTQMSPLILPLLKGVPSLYHVVIYKATCPIGTKLLPDRTFCRARAGAVCYREGCLPLRAWLPLMLQMWLWRRWRHAFDVIVTNSEAVRRHLAACESVVRGTAVVASDVGGLPEVVRDGETGFLVPPGDERALAERLLRVLSARGLAEELGKAGREDALERFRLSTCVDNFVRLYERLAATGRKYEAAGRKRRGRARTLRLKSNAER